MTATRNDERSEQTMIALTNSMAAFERVSAQLELAKIHLSNMCSTFEGRFDAGQEFDYSELAEYVEASKFLRRFGRKGDRIEFVERKMEELVPVREVRVVVHKNPVQISGGIGAISNYQVSPVDYDLGDPVGHGKTLEDALQDFEHWYQCKYDQEVKAIIIESLNY
jgi:hypothetical protein